MVNGYMGTILRIDLTHHLVTEEELEDNDTRLFIGGSGVGAKFLHTETNGRTDPLSPENVLIFMTGPFVGSPIPFSSRHSIVSKSPLTEIWGQSDVGGRWGSWLKSAGHDGIIIQGKSEQPVYVYVSEGHVEIRDARDLWGRDTYEVEEVFKQRFGPDIAVSCIGTAGEKMVRFASIMHDGKHGRAAGRCGLGAVMGSKKLKAIVIKKGNRKTTAFRRDELVEDLKKVVPKIRETRKEATLYGTSRAVTPAEALGDLPIKNWQLGGWSEGAEKISGKRMAETILVGRYSCHGCPLACGRVVRVSDGPFAPVDGAGYEYETAALLGSSCMVDNLEAIAKANELCNRHGLDTISTGGVIAFAMEAFERGAISTKDTGGLVLKWGDPHILLHLINMIVKREGIGHLLGEGSRRMSKMIGNGSDRFAVHVKGLELPGHDPRCFSGLALGYATSNRGACHNDSFSYVYEGRKSDPSLNILEPFDRLSTEGKGKFVAILQNMMALCDSLIICKFAVFGLQAADLHRWLNWITGWEISFAEFLTIGEKIFNAKRLYNVGCGIRRKDDDLPMRILTMKREGLHAPENLPNLERMLNEYYLARGWNDEGIPKKNDGLA